MQWRGSASNGCVTLRSRTMWLGGHPASCNCSGVSSMTSCTSCTLNRARSLLRSCRPCCPSHVSTSFEGHGVMVKRWHGLINKTCVVDLIRSWVQLAISQTNRLPTSLHLICDDPICEEGFLLCVTCFLLVSRVNEIKVILYCKCGWHASDLVKWWEIRGVKCSPSHTRWYWVALEKLSAQAISGLWVSW